MTARVEVRPSGVHFDVEAGETVLRAALRQGLRWPTVCGGHARCTTCYFKLLEGERHVNQSTPAEHEALRMIVRRYPGEEARIRLACQTRLTGDVTIFKRGLDPTSGER